MAVTIKDVAAAAGVSPSTVSRTCKDSPSISRETKERVRRIMAQLGYEPNFEAEPVEAFSKTIGIILPSSQRDVYENAFHLEIIRGIGQFCNQRRYVNTVITGQDDAEVLDAIQSMVANAQADGFILLYSKKDCPVAAYLRSEGLLHVVVGKAAQSANQTIYIDNDNALAGEEVLLGAKGTDAEGLALVGVLIDGQFLGQIDVLAVLLVLCDLQLAIDFIGELTEHAQTLAVAVDSGADAGVQPRGGLALVGEGQVKACGQRLHCTLDGEEVLLGAKGTNAEGLTFMGMLTDGQLLGQIDGSHLEQAALGIALLEVVHDDIQHGRGQQGAHDGQVLADGIQDQFAVAHGGFSQYKFFTDGSVSITPVVCKKEAMVQLRNNLMLFYTGTTRDSRKILNEQSDTILDKTVMLDELVNTTDRAVQALYDGNLDFWGAELDRTWEIKKKFANGVSNPQIDSMYAKAKSAGALGGKILGAGGGGFMMLYVPQQRQNLVQEALSEFTYIPFSYCHEGSRIVFSD